MLEHVPAEQLDALAAQVLAEAPFTEQVEVVESLPAVRHALMNALIEWSFSQQVLFWFVLIGASLGLVAVTLRLGAILVAAWRRRARDETPWRQARRLLAGAELAIASQQHRRAIELAVAAVFAGRRLDPRRTTPRRALAGLGDGTGEQLVLAHESVCYAGALPCPMLARAAVNAARALARGRP